jgi:hypothetical protein
MATSPLTADEVLDELAFLATVEHALIVEYLSVCSALGHDLAADEGGATTKQGSNAAGAASALALGQMFRLKHLCQALIDAGRLPELGRASGIASGAGTELSLDPPNAAQLTALTAREKAIAWALDERYVRLHAAVTTDPVFADDLLQELRHLIVDEGPTHGGALVGLQDALGEGPVSADLLRATRRDAADSFEQRLLDSSDRSYALVVAILRERFAPGSTTSGALAVTAMETLDQINRVLVQRGLLPPFTAA